MPRSTTPLNSPPPLSFSAPAPGIFDGFNSALNDQGAGELKVERTRLVRSSSVSIVSLSKESNGLKKMVLGDVIIARKSSRDETMSTPPPNRLPRRSSIPTPSPTIDSVLGPQHSSPRRPPLANGRRGSRIYIEDTSSRIPLSIRASTSLPTLSSFDVIPRPEPGVLALRRSSRQELSAPLVRPPKSVLRHSITGMNEILRSRAESSGRDVEPTVALPAPVMPLLSPVKAVEKEKEITNYSRRGSRCSGMGGDSKEVGLGLLDHDATSPPLIGKEHRRSSMGGIALEQDFLPVSDYRHSVPPLVIRRPSLIPSKPAHLSATNFARPASLIPLATLRRTDARRASAQGRLEPSSAFNAAPPPIIKSTQAAPHYVLRPTVSLGTQTPDAWSDSPAASMIIAPSETTTTPPVSTSSSTTNTTQSRSSMLFTDQTNGKTSGEGRGVNEVGSSILSESAWMMTPTQAQSSFTPPTPLLAISMEGVDDARTIELDHECEAQRTSLLCPPSPSIYSVTGSTGSNEDVEARGEHGDRPGSSSGETTMMDHSPNGFLSTTNLSTPNANLMNISPIFVTTPKSPRLHDTPLHLPATDDAHRPSSPLLTTSSFAPDASKSLSPLSTTPLFSSASKPVATLSPGEIDAARRHSIFGTFTSPDIDHIDFSSSSYPDDTGLSSSDRIPTPVIFLRRDSVQIGSTTKERIRNGRSFFLAQDAARLIPKNVVESYHSHSNRSSWYESEEEEEVAAVMKRVVVKRLPPLPVVSGGVGMAV